MSLVYGLKLACDLTHLAALIALLGLTGSGAPKLLVLSLLLGAGAGIGDRCKHRGEKARYAPLLLGLLTLSMKPSRADILFSVPLAVYALMYVKGNRRATDYYYANERFRYGLIAIMFVLLISLLTDLGGFTAAVPALFLHLALSVTLLRMLRHEKHVIVQRKFQLMNLLGVLSMCAVGMSLSTDWVLNGLKKLGSLACDHLLLPAIQALVWLIELVMRAVNSLISLLPFEEGAIELSGELSLEMSEMGEASMMPETMADVVSNPMLKQILQIIGVVILGIVVFFVLRALSKQSARGAETEKQDERERLDEPNRLQNALGGALRRRGDPVLGVRHVYRKFLRMAEGRSLPLNGCQNSLQIRNLAQDQFDSQALDDLRSAYIRARYDAFASEETLAQAKDALGRLKKKN